MAAIASDTPQPRLGGELPVVPSITPTAALRQAWIWYLALAFIPFILFCSAVIYLNYNSEIPAGIVFRGGWFFGSIAFMLVAGPIAFAARSHLFRPYWRGEPVAPKSYLRGMLLTWFAFEIGGILALTGCFMTSSLLPCLLPALAAFMFFATLWPNGRAMVSPTGNTDDPEIYQEPR